MSFLFFFSLFFLPSGMSMLGSCPLWTSFEQVTWGIRFYPNKGPLGHLLQHENNSTGLDKRLLINLKPSGLLWIYLSFAWSIFLTTYRYMSIYLVFLLSLYKSIYLNFLCLLSICLSSYLSNQSNQPNLSHLSHLSNLSNLSTLSNLSIDRSIDLSIDRSIDLSIDRSILFHSILFFSILV